MKTLNLKKISYRYPLVEKYALNEADIEFHSGEKCVILGKNGSGKSTLFLMSSGIIEPLKGDIFLDGAKINKKNLKELRKTIGLVFQDPEVQFVAPTVMEEISFGLMNMGLPREEVRERTLKTIDVLNISHLKDKSLYALSGGEKKLVSIASVLAMEPDIIFFDEPTAGVDYPNQLIFMDVLEILSKKGLGLIISTHDLDFAWEWAERAVILKEGKILKDGECDEILTNKLLMKEAFLPIPKLVEFSEIMGIECVKTMEELKKQS